MKCTAEEEAQRLAAQKEAQKRMEEKKATEKAQRLKELEEMKEAEKLKALDVSGRSATGVFSMGHGATLLKQRSGTRAVQIRGMQAEVCSTLARRGRDRLTFAERWPKLAEFVPTAFIFGLHLTKCGTTSTDADQITLGVGQT